MPVVQMVQQRWIVCRDGRQLASKGVTDSEAKMVGVIGVVVCG
jgi:hypothetical protein